MSQVSLAVAYAHSKGVVHRDIKPANIMLGDFGEVYILDWGVAKIVNVADLEPGPASSSGGLRTRRAASESVRPADTEIIENTQAGALLGTPGYMSPEQARGEASECDGRADVYALGAVLHELLVFEPVHRGKHLGELILSTSKLDGARPSALDAELPRALDDICHRATRLERADRFHSARELHDAIECYLDGERDRERQTVLADEHTTRAEALRIEETKPGADVEARRGEVMRELGAALALDPTHARARRLLLDVLLHEPDTMPPEAERELEELNRKDRAKSAMVAALSYMSWYAMTPILFWMGIRSVPWLVVLDVAVLSLIVYQLWMERTGNAHPLYIRIANFRNLVIASLLRVFFGPLMLVPQAVTTIGATFMVSIRANRLTHIYITAASVRGRRRADHPRLPRGDSRSVFVRRRHARHSPARGELQTAADDDLLRGVDDLLAPHARQSSLIGRGVEALLSSERRNFRARASGSGSSFPKRLSRLRRSPSAGNRGERRSARDHGSYRDVLVGIVREIGLGERRVAATPETTRRLLKLGFEVVVETNAGELASFQDADFVAAGATIADDAIDIWSKADIVLKVRPPARREDGTHEAELIREGATLVSFIWPSKNPELLAMLSVRKATVLAMDLIPRITRAQKMDALSSMANIAGYRAVIEAASFFGRFFTGQMTAAGQVPPAKVLVIGAGVAGLAAIGAARSLGAIVRAFDTRPGVKEQVESLGAEFLELEYVEEGAGRRRLRA